MSQPSVWTTSGFEAFREGSFGNGGQNLYVSRSGVLQRIHQFDFNGDGYLDLIFCNSQSHAEKPPSYVYSDPLGEAKRCLLPSDGAISGAVADLNGNGYYDLVLGMEYNGIRRDLNAFIYFGSPDGFSERRVQYLPVPQCTSVTAGDFNGDGRPDLAFLSEGKVRIFYQSELGFEPKRFVDLDIPGDQLGASDLDADGCAELLVRAGESLTICWGGNEGIRADFSSSVPAEHSRAQDSVTETEPSHMAAYAERDPEASILVKVVHLDSTPHLFAPRPDEVLLIPLLPDRQFGDPLVFSCENTFSVAAGDINGDGHQDLVFACRQNAGGKECSWIYWGSDEGFSDERRTAVASFQACDMAVGDLDGNGYDDVVISQAHTAASYTANSLVYRGSSEGVESEVIGLQTEDARRVLLARPAPDELPNIVFVNRMGRNRLGNIPVSLYWGSAEGFSPERRTDLPGWGAVEALTGDLNDDGYADLVLVNASENSIDQDPGSYVYLNGPDGFSDKPNLLLPTTRAHGACVGDLNRDGYLDLIFCGFSNPEIIIFYGTEDGFDTDNPTRILLEHDGILYDDPRWIYLADLNNDGWLDLVVPQIESDRSLILWGGSEGFSMERVQWLSVFHGACARAADLNGNGYLDLIIGGHQATRGEPHDSFVYIYWNGPGGLREDQRTLLPSNAVNAMAVADFNNDGALDIFVCSYHKGIERDLDSYIYWNRQGKGFSATDRTRLFTHSASGCVAADFNEDGWTDLAIAFHKVAGDHIGHSVVLWNGPEGFDENRSTTLPSSGPHGMTSVGPGNQRDRGLEEYYESVPYPLPKGATPVQIGWTAEIPTKTWVRAQLRTASTSEGLLSAKWSGPDGEDSWYECSQPVAHHGEYGRWVQYRLALGAINGVSTPRVTAVHLKYEA
ncbi:MAG: VCBS repeat-containing protein [Planctomycetota bacterium]|jgi:hypothetical protein|nr:VCBS repeat-containing protein [Planctomycetota bacterium]